MIVLGTLKAAVPHEISEMYFHVCAIAVSRRSEEDEDSELSDVQPGYMPTFYQPYYFTHLNFGGYGGKDLPYGRSAAPQVQTNYVPWKEV